MTIQSVAISNTFNEFRQTTNLVIDEVNKLGDGTANLVINTINANTISSSSANLSISGNLVVDTITANSYVGVSSDLTVAGNTGSDVVSLASETLNIVGTNGITTSVASNTVSVNLGNNLSISSLRLNGSSTGYVQLQPASSGTNQAYTLPASDGLNGQVLQTNGVGSLSWVNQATGGGGGGGGSGTSTARTAFTASGGQTTFSVTYTVGQVDVYMNGSKLVANNDFTAADGTSIVLAAGATAGDIVETVSYSSQWITSGSNLYYANGSIGVGTTNPASRLHVASANTAFAVGTIRLDGADGAGTVNAPVTINAVTGGGTGNGGSQLYFETRAENGSLAERIRFDHTGNTVITGNFLPNANVTYDLGSPNYRFKDLYLSGSSIILGGATITASGNTIILPSGSSISGNADLDTITTTGNATIGGNLTVSANLIVNGTTTTINSTTLAVDDKNIVLGDTASPSDVSADGGGITLKGSTDKTFNWVDATDAWTSSEHLAVSAGKNVILNGSSSGKVTLAVPATAGTTTITLPATTGTVVTTGDTGSVTNAMLAGSIATSKISGLAASATTDTTNASNITTGTIANARTTAASANGASTIVARDANGDFAGRTITATTFSGSGASLTSIPAGQVTGTLAVANGGTGQTSLQSAINSLVGGVTSGQYLRGNGTNVVMSAIQAADVPTLNQNTTGTSSNVTGTVAVGNGGTGATTAQGAMNTFAGAVTTGQYLRGNGTNVVMSAIQAADVPTLNQNTTGTSSNVTGTVAVGNGGTGATTAPNARTNLGATTLGSNLFTITNPSAVTFPRFNADNTVSSLDAATFRTAIGAGTSSTTGTVTSVGGTGTVSGISLSGTVTTTGNLTLSGTLAVTPSNFASQSANAFLAAPNGAAGVPTFRTIVAADIPTLNQNTTGTAAGLSSTLAIASGGTGTTTAQGAMNTFAGAVTSGQYLRGNGTNVVMSAIQAADVPTLNQNTTGTASNVTGTVAVGNGGTGATTAGGALTNLGAAAVGQTMHIGTTAVAINRASASLSLTGVNIDGSAGSVAWTNVSGRPTAVSSFSNDSGYITSSASITGSASTFTSTTQNSQFNSVGVGTAGSGTAGEIRATNNIIAYYSSDRKFKENIRDVSDAISIVSAIGTKTFDWSDEYINDRGGEDGYFIVKNDFGVIAQDVQQVFPLAVRTREDGSLAVNYEKLAILAFAAIKEQQDQIDELRKMILSK